MRKENKELKFSNKRQRIIYNEKTAKIKSQRVVLNGIKRKQVNLGKQLKHEQEKDQIERNRIQKKMERER